MFEGEEDLDHADELRQEEEYREEIRAKERAREEEKERRVKRSMEKEAALKIEKVSIQEVLQTTEDIGSFGDTEYGDR